LADSKFHVAAAPTRLKAEHYEQNRNFREVCQPLQSVRGLNF